MGLSHISAQNRKEEKRMNKKREMIVLAIMCFILSIAIAVQIKTVNNNGTTIGSSQSVSNLKAQVLRMREKYENEYRLLEDLTDELENVRKNVASRNDELKALEDKIKEDNLLLGNTNVKGQGVIITLNDGKLELNSLLNPKYVIIHDGDVLDVINELRNAGAEAISINDERIVNKTAISCDGNVIVVNGEKIGTPIVISAIGYPAKLATLDRPGGTLEYLREVRNVELKKSNNIEISKYSGVYSYKYAKTVE